MQEFPVLKEKERQYHTIPWEVAEIAYREYAQQYGTQQSLERIAQRGGFAESELDMLYPDWRKHTNKIHGGNR